MPELDRKATSVFAGKVVRKDLVRKVKVGANVPVFVVEYLLGKYCATDDPVAIDAGLKVANNILSSNFVRPDEANKAQSMIKDKGKHTLIDKVQVRYVSENDKHWAELKNFGHKFVHIPEHFLREFDRLLMGGIWAQMDIRHAFDQEEKGKRSPFWIDRLKPIQVATFDPNEYRTCRSQFTTDEWIDLLLRTIGLEPSYFNRRQKLHYLVRLIPLAETNYNLVELGPRETGKSYGYQELSPYTLLLTGSTTVANLFFNMASGKMGLVGIWDAIGFDEVADLQKMSKEVVTTLKTYCESGTFARGKDSLTGMASIAMFGNTNRPVDVMVRSSHLFMPMPDVIRDDMAFLDRIHFYIPGWELPKMKVEFFTNHYGFVVDYLAEALRELRQHTYTETLDRHFSLGSHLKSRDVKAVRKTVSGLVKLIYPNGELSKDEVAELTGLALEGRRRVKEQLNRVKEQLKKMGSFEFHQTSFSLIDNESREERFVGVPEQGGRDMIATDPLAPGSVYTASVDDHGNVGLYRLEVGCTPGTGKLKIAGGIEGQMKESFQRAFAYLQSQKVKMRLGKQMDTTDFHVEAIDLLSNHVSCETGIAVVVAVFSAIKSQSVLAGLMILGDLSIQGNIKAVRTLAEPLQVGMDNGARRALVPLENKRNFLDVSGDIVERVDPVFFSDPMTAAMKALGMT